MTFAGLELIKVLSISAAVKRMELAAFENYITHELHSAVSGAIYPDVTRSRFAKS
ncbi:MAG: hypothetical protein RR091_12600 [Cloacibacillus sp.]